MTNRPRIELSWRQFRSAERRIVVQHLFEIYWAEPSHPASENETEKKQLLWHLQKNGIRPLGWLSTETLTSVWLLDASHLLWSLLYVYSSKATIVHEGNSTVWRQILQEWPYARSTYVDQLAGAIGNPPNDNSGKS